MRVHLCYSILPLLAAACEPMENPGSAFEPVQVSAVAELASAADLEDDLLFPEEEPVVISSDELGPKTAEPAPRPVAVQPAPAPSAPAPDPFMAATAANCALVIRSQPPSASQGWPLRLVATVPQAQPPRAIVGLPSGDEVVVTPGTMMPEAGVVVMSIGANTLELVEINAAGDHAEVSSRTLQTQQAVSAPAGL